MWVIAPIGASPRARSEPWPGLGGSRIQRSISAYAERTPAVPGRTCLPTEHLRVRGEGSLQIGRGEEVNGASPRTRRGPVATEQAAQLVWSSAYAERNRR